MKRKKKKAVVRAIFLYLLLTTGIYMFITSYSNSHNRLTTEKISPASMTFNGAKAKVNVLESSFTVDMELFMPESRFYYVTYLISPDEVRLMTVLMSLTDKL